MVEEEIKPKVRAEGRVIKIEIYANEARHIKWLNSEDEAPILLIFDGRNGRYLTVYDHRKESRKALEISKEHFVDQFRGNVPCLAGFRVKRGLYLILTDIGTDDVADKGESWILTRNGNGYNHKTHKMVEKACHIATGICLVEPR